MKKICSTVMSALLISICSLAQEAKIHELGINFSNLNNFGIRYKTGNEKTLLRLTFLSLNGTNQNIIQNSQDYSKTNSFGFGFNIGFEKRKSIAEKLDFYYGCDLKTSFQSQKVDYAQTDETINNQTIIPGLGLVLGFDYAIKSSISISAEIVPSIWYSYDKSIQTLNGIEYKEINKIFGYGFSNSGASLTLAYRFGKKD